MYIYIFQEGSSSRIAMSAYFVLDAESFMEKSII